MDHSELLHGRSVRTDTAEHVGDVPRRTPLPATTLGSVESASTKRNWQVSQRHHTSDRRYGGRPFATPGSWPTTASTLRFGRRSIAQAARPRSRRSVVPSSIGRFLMHLLPPRRMRIRYYGMYVGPPAERGHRSAARHHAGEAVTDDKESTTARDLDGDAEKHRGSTGRRVSGARSRCCTSPRSRPRPAGGERETRRGIFPAVRWPTLRTHHDLHEHHQR